MITVATDALMALTLWSALNLGLMLLLALNVFRWRAKENVAVGTGDSARLERAIRAHGNNTEYVPGILLAVLLLALLGESTTTLHTAGALLLLSRLLHAHGIQQIGKNLPVTRVAGNLICWVLFGALIVRLLVLTVG